MDTLILGGTVVTEDGVATLDIAFPTAGSPCCRHRAARCPPTGSSMRRVSWSWRRRAVDAHVHFTGSNPFPEQELFDGTCAAAMGGVTTIVEMPHSNPPATTLAAFEAKKAMAARQCVVDFGLWGGLDGKNLDELPRMRDAGALAFKGFLCSSERDRKASDPRPAGAE